MYRCGTMTVVVGVCGGGLVRALGHLVPHTRLWRKE